MDNNNSSLGSAQRHKSAAGGGLACLPSRSRHPPEPNRQSSPALYEIKSEDAGNDCAAGVLNDLEIEEGIRVLFQKGVRMMAWDFDLTAFAKHTGGGVPFSSNVVDLTTLLSSEFVKSVPIAQKYGIRVAIVTYSDDADDRSFGGDVFLQTILSACFRKKEIWNTILIAAANPRLHYEPLEISDDESFTGKDDSSSFKNKFKGLNPCQLSECQCLNYTEPFHVSRCKGKEWHLTKVMDEHKIRTGKSIEKKQVLLIDDSISNIRQAKKDGFLTFEVSGGFGMTSQIWRQMIVSVASELR
jgi:hypothetical protein